MIDTTTRTLPGVAALTASVLFGVVIILQTLYALGALPPTMLWGGRNETLTVGLRLGSVAAAFVLAGFAYVILRRAGLIVGVEVTTWVKILSWVVTAYMALNVLGNWTSPSAAEKWTFGPITTLLLIACAIVSTSKAP